MSQVRVTIDWGAVKLDIVEFVRHRSRCSSPGNRMSIRSRQPN